jgi:hypothetical protein
MMPKLLRAPKAYEKGALLAEYGAAFGEGEVVLSPMSFALIQSKVK